MKIHKFKDIKLNEGPDYIFYQNSNDQNTQLEYFDAVAKAFAWKPELEFREIKKNNDGTPVKLDVWLSDEMNSHIFCPFLSDKIRYNNLLHKGRLWFKDKSGVELKIISFWDIEDISKKEMRLLIADLERVSGLDLSDWSIETHQDDDETYLIPVSKYIKVTLSETEKKIRDLKQKLHTSSPQNKKNIIRQIEELTNKKFKPDGFGSEFYKDKLPKGMTTVEYKNKSTKYQYTETVKIMKFNDYEKL